MTRDQALSQLGLTGNATQEQIETAYRAAVSELDTLRENLRGTSLSFSFKGAREDLEQAYEVLRRAPAPKVPVEPAERERPAPAPEARAAEKGRKKNRKRKAGPRLEKPVEGMEADWKKQLEEASGEVAAARMAAVAARREVEESRKVIEQLRSQAEAGRAEVERLAAEAKAIQKAMAELRTEAQREVEAIRNARRTGDEAVKSLYRSEEEANAAATHAQAYRDGAMYASQAVEKLLRELSS